MDTMNTPSPSLSDIIMMRHIATSAALANPYGAVVIRPDGSTRTVQNLGWLLRHAADVRHPLQGIAFSVETWRYGSADDRPLVGADPHTGQTIRSGPLPIIEHDAVLIAYLADGTVYATTWQDRGLLLDWLDRPSFRGYLMDYNARPFKGTDYSATCAIGGRDFRAIEPYPARIGAN